MTALTVGAVAYDPRVVTIWERFRDYFAVAGAPVDYVLYSNYERLVDAVAEGAVEIGWNTNTAFVALERRLGRQLPILGMRDVDAAYASVIVTRRGETFEDPRALVGRRLAIGSRDCAHAAILPLHFLRLQGVDAVRECRLTQFDADLGKHGDTTASELSVLRAVADGEADAGAVGDATWAHLRAEGVPVVEPLEIAWRSPAYSHCNFTASPSLDEASARRFQQALLGMRWDDPDWRDAMELEGVRRWLPGDRGGYDALFAALDDDPDASSRPAAGGGAQR